MYPTMYRALHRAPLATLKINVPRYSIESETRNRGKKSRSVFVTYSTTIFLASFITPSPLFPFCVRKKKGLKLWCVLMSDCFLRHSPTPTARPSLTSIVQCVRPIGSFYLSCQPSPASPSHLLILLSGLFWPWHTLCFWWRRTWSRGEKGKERKGREQLYPSSTVASSPIILRTEVHIETGASLLSPARAQLSDIYWQGRRRLVQSSSSSSLASTARLARRLKEDKVQSKSIMQVLTSCPYASMYALSHMP